MTETTIAPESREYKTEVKQLLDILAHSLYTDREIFLRELISNASDALNRIQFEMLTNQDVVDADAKLAIEVRFDSQAKTITVSDTGKGMNHDELIENLTLTMNKIRQEEITTEILEVVGGAEAQK